MIYRITNNTAPAVALDDIPVVSYAAFYDDLAARLCDERYHVAHYFALPDECAGHDTLVVRCRVWKDQRCDLTSTSTIGGSGTNRMCAFSIAKRTK